MIVNQNIYIKVPVIAFSLVLLEILFCSCCNLCVLFCFIFDPMSGSLGITAIN